MKILKSTVIQTATIQMEDWEERHSENRYAVLWKAKDEENRYLARSLQDAQEYYEYRCLLVGQNRI
jgi:metal-responsive CopG/Arc/MetJ family transcriptional regulator